MRNPDEASVRATILYTASWSALYAASKAGPLPVMPVRTSRGNPRFWSAAGAFPVVDELLPEPWMLGIKDAEKFGRAYRRKLHQIGLPAIQARLDAIADECGMPLVIACFEKDVSECHRAHLATWWQRKTGVVVPEWTPDGGEA
jgi:hypothetical protein